MNIRMHLKISKIKTIYVFICYVLKFLMHITIVIIIKEKSFFIYKFKILIYTINIYESHSKYIHIIYLFR